MVCRIGGYCFCADIIKKVSMRYTPRLLSLWVVELFHGNLLAVYYVDTCWERVESIALYYLLLYQVALQVVNVDGAVGVLGD